MRSHQWTTKKEHSSCWVTHSKPDLHSYQIRSQKLLSKATNYKLMLLSRTSIQISKRKSAKTMKLSLIPRKPRKTRKTNNNSRTSSILIYKAWMMQLIKAAAFRTVSPRKLNWYNGIRTEMVLALMWNHLKLLRHKLWTGFRTVVAMARSKLIWKDLSTFGWKM